MNLDKDGNGALDPGELYPVIVEMSEAHPFSVSLDQCREFTAIFDQDRNGVITLQEFTDFVQFVMVMAYLHECPQAAEALAVHEGTKNVKELIDMLQSNRDTIAEVIPFL